jgi:hypothetical protein
VDRYDGNLRVTMANADEIPEDPNASGRELDEPTAVELPPGVFGEHEGAPAGRAVAAQAGADEFVECGWMTPSGPCHLVRDHPLFPFGPREDSGHISEASAAENSARIAARERPPD